MEMKFCKIFNIFYSIFLFLIYLFFFFRNRAKTYQSNVHEMLINWKNQKEAEELEIVENPFLHFNNTNTVDSFLVSSLLSLKKREIEDFKFYPTQKIYAPSQVVHGDSFEIELRYPEDDYFKETFYPKPKNITLEIDCLSGYEYLLFSDTMSGSIRFQKGKSYTLKDLIDDTENKRYHLKVETKDFNPKGTYT